jgi:hypothetical protein
LPENIETAADRPVPAGFDQSFSKEVFLQANFTTFRDPYLNESIIIGYLIVHDSFLQDLERTSLYPQQ